MSKPTQLTIEKLKAMGFIPHINFGTVERWIPNNAHPGGGFRKDFLSIIDILVVDPLFNLGIQSCGQDFASHRRKLCEEMADSTVAWLSNATNRLELWGWRKIKKKRGGKVMIWAMRHGLITLENGKIMFHEIKLRGAI